MDAYAPSFYPAAVVQQVTSSEDRRSLYMTFSSGAPFTSKEIKEHFNRLYGRRCVVHVYVQDKNPKYGKIIFRRVEMPAYILGAQEVVKIMVNNKPIWLKQYVARTIRRSINNRDYRI